MNSRMIIIAILILIKVIGVASRVKAENYIPGYTCDSSMTYKINYPYYYKTSQIGLESCSANSTNNFPLGLPRIDSIESTPSRTSL